MCGVGKTTTSLRVKVGVALYDVPPAGPVGDLCDLPTQLAEGLDVVGTESAQLAFPLTAMLAPETTQT